MANTLETNILTVTSTNELKPSSHFQQVLDEIPGHLEKAENYLADYREDPSGFVKEIDEDAFSAFNNEMGDLVTFSREVEGSLKELRKFFNNQRDEVVGHFTDKLEANGFDRIKEAHNDVKQLKRDMTAQRQHDRWNELKSVFEKSIQHYERIQRLTPELTDFSQFQLRHPNLVSGAKTKPLKQADKTELAERIEAWDKALQMIDDNLWGLNHTYLNQLIQLFKQEPDTLNVYETGTELKAKQDAEQKQKEEQERIRKENEAKLKEAEARAKAKQEELKALKEQARKAEGERKKQLEQSLQETKQEAQQAKLSAWENQQALENWYKKELPNGFKQSYPHTVEYLFNHDDYKDLASSDKAKAGAIYSIAMQLGQANSAVQQDINGNPTEFLKLVRLILDA